MARQRVAAASGQSRVAGEFPQRIVLGLAILLAVVFIALAAIGGGLTYYVITAVSTQESVSPTNYLVGGSSTLNFNDHEGGEHDGWLLLGLHGAPTIILCPGYDANRSDLLSLGSMLRDNHFNVYIFNF